MNQEVRLFLPIPEYEFYLIHNSPNNSFPTLLKSRWGVLSCVIFYFKNYFIILGASIIETGTSESYKNDKAKLHWHGIGFLNYEMPPDIILQVKVTLRVTCLYFRILFLFFIMKILISKMEATLNLSQHLKLSLYSYSHQTTWIISCFMVSKLWVIINLLF